MTCRICTFISGQTSISLLKISRFVTENTSFVVFYLILRKIFLKSHEYLFKHGVNATMELELWISLVFDEIRLKKKMIEYERWL